jgi:hypothetical protein
MSRGLYKRDPASLGIFFRESATLTLALSGWTYRNTFVLYDKESGSFWYPYRDGLRGIQGKYFGSVLPKIDSEDTRWGRWVAKHPDSKILR